MSDHTYEVMMNWMWAAIILTVGIVAMMIVCAIVRAAMKKANAEPLLISFVVVLIRVIMIAVAIIAALEKVGLKSSSLVTVLGVAGAAVALAVKDSLANIAGGVMIIVTHQFKKDDYIEVAGYGGYVQMTDLLMTTLRQYDNTIVSIPNTLLSSSVVLNHDSKGSRRVNVRVTVDIDEDLTKVKQILMDVAKNSPVLLESPAPAAHVDHAGEGIAAIDLFCWCRHDEYWEAYYYMNEHVAEALKEAGIESRGKTQQIRVIDMDGEEGGEE